VLLVEDLVLDFLGPGVEEPATDMELLEYSMDVNMELGAAGEPQLAEMRKEAEARMRTVLDEMGGAYGEFQALCAADGWEGSAGEVRARVGDYRYLERILDRIAERGEELDDQN
jgi:hypothetical protein